MIEPNLLFKSSFGEGVYIAPPYNKNNMWVQEVNGTDNESGYSWERDFPGYSTLNYFGYGINIDKNLEDYVETKIETVTGRDNRPVRALHQLIKQDDVDNTLLTRNQYNAFPSDDETSGNLKQLYMGYNIRLQENLNDVLSQRALMEWNNEDYRWGLYIVKDTLGTPVWQLQAEILSGDNAGIDWIELNNNVSVPIGEFFKLEVFWKHSTYEEGRIWVAVNGVDVFYHRGRNKIDEKIGVWNPFKVLGSLELGWQHQWITNVEVWDDIPLCVKKKKSSAFIHALVTGTLIWFANVEEQK